MREWTRREVLAALGLGGAAAVPLLSACGAGATLRAAARPEHRRSLASLRAQLRDTVAALETRLEGAYAAAQIDRIDSARADAAEIATGRDERLRLYLGGRAKGRWREVAISSSDPDRIAEAAAALTAGTDLRGVRATSSRRLVEIEAPPEIDPRQLARAVWPDRLAALRELAESVGGSRIVYRGAYLRVFDRQCIYIDPEREIAERQVRTRAGVAMVAWTGDTAAAATAERAGAIGPKQALGLGTDELEEAAEGALSLLSARGGVDGELDAILAPEVAALLAHRCIAEALRADLWLDGGARAAGLVGQRVSAPRLALADDPGARGRYGSYAHDDEGTAARRMPLIEDGVLQGPLSCRRSAAALGLEPSGHGRRAAPGQPVRPSPAHVTVAAGEASLDDLVAEVEHGVLLEGALEARIDPRDWSAVLRARTGREIVGGRTTGRRFADLILRGRVPELLASVRGVGAEPRAFAAADDGGPCTSRSAPALLLRGRVLGGGA